jgi:hypothetical protein
MVISELCIRCKGKGLCGERCIILDKFISNSPKPTTHFHGKSAPEVFVGRIGYPYVNSGILAPSENDNVANFSSAEEWSKSNFSIENVLRLRGQLIYGRGNSHIKQSSSLKQVTQELALSSKAVSTEIFLKKKPTFNFTTSAVFSPMTNPAPIERALLEENPVVHKKVDYLTSDYDVKSVRALKELYSSGIKVDHLQKLLSVGLLGTKIRRRMVPTRWSITATDDTLSKQLLEKIRYYPEIDKVLVFSGNFVGNFIEILFLPGVFSFEAIEAWEGESVYGGNQTNFSQDYEGFGGRKTYASNVTGGYYAMRLPVCELLEKIKKQGTVFVFRKITKEYYAPLGVGVVRECTRRAVNSEEKDFDSIEDALKNISERIGFSVETLKEKSWTLQNYGKQKNLKDWFQPTR